MKGCLGSLDKTDGSGGHKFHPPRKQAKSTLFEASTNANDNTKLGMYIYIYIYVLSSFWGGAQIGNLSRNPVLLWKS